MKNNTILNEKMNEAINPSEAWRLGDQYFLAVEAEEYKRLSKENLTTLLLSASALQKENGLLPLYEDPTMPGDARVDIIYRPSYAISAVAIYAYLNYPELFNEELKAFLSNLLEGAFQHGIIGHGIESEETVRRTLLMLCKAGLRVFLVRYHKEHLAFAHAMHRHMTQFEELGDRIDKENLIVTANGFSTDSINHLIKELVAYWNGNNRPVFVYGTLMKGEHAHKILATAEYAGRCQLRDYAMYHLGSYPGIKPYTGESVLGELYFTNAETIRLLDRYEDEGSLYDRATVTITLGNQPFNAEAYVYKKDVLHSVKMREIWNAADEDLVWYACYGSNLSNKRFSCYISGGTCAENGRTYQGSLDPTPARAILKKSYPGKLYFGNSSSSWNGCGVAFYDPNPSNEGARVYMKLYLITRQQLHDVMRQEGPSPNWYGRLVCLEVDDFGIPVYTLTSETRRPANAPSPAYANLIADVLKNEFHLRETQVNRYLQENQ